VASIRFCAGLTPGKYSKTPKPKKISPTEIRSHVVLRSINGGDSGLRNAELGVGRLHALFLARALNEIEAFPDR